MSRILTSVLSVDINDRSTSGKVKPIRPTEILCQILQFVARSDGVKALLPLTHVDTQWRRAALGDSSLWTTIYLYRTPLPLLDMVLARAGNQLFTVYANYHDLEDHATLSVLIDRIEELYYSAGFEYLASLIAVSAPNLKVLHLRPESNIQGVGDMMRYITVPTVFDSSRFPLLRDLAITNAAILLSGPFKGLTSFECDISDRPATSPARVFGAIQESPLIETLRLVGRCFPPKEVDLPPIVLPLLGECSLIGEGITSLIRFITLPATAFVFLGKQYADDQVDFPFNMLSIAPGLRILGEVSAVSFSIDDYTSRLQARNNHGGVLDVEVDGLYYLSGDPSAFLCFIWSSFSCWPPCTGLETTKELTLCIERDGIWKPRDTTNSAINLVRFISNLPDIEGAKLHGLPPSELSSVLSLLTSPRVATIKPRYPNLKRLDIESSPIRSPRLLLVELGKLLAARKEAGTPLQSVTVKVRCEMLIPAMNHCAFLTSWESLVEEGVGLEYEQIEVKKLLWRSYHSYPEDEGGERDEESDGEDGTGDFGDCVGWGSWPEKWPKTVKEMRG